MYVYILVTSWIYTVFVSYMITTLYWRRTYLNVKFIIYTHIQRHTCSHMYTRKILPLLGGDAPNLFQGCNQVTGLKIFTSEKRNDNWSLTGMMEWWNDGLEATLFSIFFYFFPKKTRNIQTCSGSSFSFWSWSTRENATGSYRFMVEQCRIFDPLSSYSPRLHKKRHV